METFHRLAGVQDPFPRNDPDGTHDQAPHPVHDSRASNDETSADRISQHPSRANLPLNQKASQRSLGRTREATKTAPTAQTPSNQQQQQQPPQTGHSRDTNNPPDEPTAEEGDDDEWGPAHPCFPHPNPHCLPNSHEAQTTRVIRVRRDWMTFGDKCPQFANLWPEIIAPWVTEEDFRVVISTLNKHLQAAFDPFTANAWFDALLGVATGFLWDDLGFTAAKRRMKVIEAFVDTWNADKAREGKEVKLIPLRRTGFMALDFVIPDPEVDEEHSVREVREDRPIS